MRALLRKVVTVLICLTVVFSIIGGTGVKANAATADVEGFVERLYVYVLERPSDRSGREFWVGILESGIPATVVVDAFFNSDEMRNRNLSNEDFMDIVYRSLLGREPDASGKAFWVSVLESGRSRAWVAAANAVSDEFSRICERYGITRGSFFIRNQTPAPAASRPTQSAPAATNNPNDATGKQVFIRRCYNAFLNREPSQNDFNFWTDSFNKGMTATRFIQNIMKSEEYRNKHTSNDVFIDDVYVGMLNHSADDATKSSWNNKLTTNSARYALPNTIAQTTEFKNICASLGITAGLYDLTGTGTWKHVNGQRVLEDRDTGFYANCGWIYCDGYRYYFNSQGYLVQDVDSILGRQDQYYLTVNTSTNIVTVYARTYAGGAFDTPVKSFLCSCGLSSSPTINGTFTLRRINEQWHVLMGNVWGQYCTQISGNYLFHSVWYYERGNTRSISVEQFSRLGQNASHGCVRISVPDAKWIWDNCNGSQVTVTTSCGQPFDRPTGYSAVRVSGDYGYDPRDPGL